MSYADGCEVDIDTNISDCGACGVVCSTNHITPTCANGSCDAGTCATGYVDCNANKQMDGCETNSATDVNNCGACGNDCTAKSEVASATCSSGECVVESCESGFADCDKSGADGCEVNVTVDVNNCGGCGTVCSSNNVTVNSCGGAVCHGTCADGWANCTGTLQAKGCNDPITTDVENCGACGVVCSTNHITPACANGSCDAGTCAAGYLDCDNEKQADGCETNSATDVTNCGACGNDCSTKPEVMSATCSSGACQLTCEPGYANCNNSSADGCETNIEKSVGDCGVCGAACSSVNVMTNACSSGSCSGTCTSGWANCTRTLRANGCNDPISSDVSNCGGCGIQCSSVNVAANSCAGGTCTSTCQSGWANCSNTLQANGCNDPS